MKTALFAAIFYLGCFCNAAAQQQYILGSCFIEPLTNKAGQGYLDLITKETFRRLQLNVKIIQYPCQRSIQMANAGIIDGDLLRIAEIDRLYGNLVRVEESSMNFDFVVFKKSKHIKLTDRQSFSPYSAAVVRGWKILENIISKAQEIHYLNSPQALFKFLDMDRTDIIIFERFEGLFLLQQLHIKHVIVQQRPIISRKMHLFLHRKHAKLAPQLAKTLATIKRQKLYIDVLNGQAN